MLDQRAQSYERIARESAIKREETTRTQKAQASGFNTFQTTGGKVGASAGNVQIYEGSRQQKSIGTLIYSSGGARGNPQPQQAPLPTSDANYLLEEQKNREAYNSSNTLQAQRNIEQARQEGRLVTIKAQTYNAYLDLMYKNEPRRRAQSGEVNYLIFEKSNKQYAKEYLERPTTFKGNPVKQILTGELWTFQREKPVSREERFKNEIVGYGEKALNYGGLKLSQANKVVSGYFKPESKALDVYSERFDTFLEKRGLQASSLKSQGGLKGFYYGQVERSVNANRVVLQTSYGGLSYALNKPVTFAGFTALTYGSGFIFGKVAGGTFGGLFKLSQSNNVVLRSNAVGLSKGLKASSVLVFGAFLKKDYETFMLKPKSERADFFATTSLNYAVFGAGAKRGFAKTDFGRMNEYAQELRKSDFKIDFKEYYAQATDTLFYKKADLEFINPNVNVKYARGGEIYGFSTYKNQILRGTSLKGGNQYFKVKGYVNPEGSGFTMFTFNKGKGLLVQESNARTGFITETFYKKDFKGNFKSMFEVKKPFKTDFMLKEPIFIKEVGEVSRIGFLERKEVNKNIFGFQNIGSSKTLFTLDFKNYSYKKDIKLNAFDYAQHFINKGQLNIVTVESLGKAGGKFIRSNNNYTPSTILMDTRPTKNFIIFTKQFLNKYYNTNNMKGTIQIGGKSAIFRHELGHFELYNRALLQDYKNPEIRGFNENYAFSKSLNPFARYFLKTETKNIKYPSYNFQKGRKQNLFVDEAKSFFRRTTTLKSEDFTATDLIYKKATIIKTNKGNLIEFPIKKINEQTGFTLERKGDVVNLFIKRTKYERVPYEPKPEVNTINIQSPTDIYLDFPTIYKAQQSTTIKGEGTIYFTKNQPVNKPFTTKAKLTPDKTSNLFEQTTFTRETLISKKSFEKNLNVLESGKLQTQVFQKPKNANDVLKLNVYQKTEVKPIQSIQPTTQQPRASFNNPSLEAQGVVLPKLNINSTSINSTFKTPSLLNNQRSNIRQTLIPNLLITSKQPTNIYKNNTTYLTRNSQININQNAQINKNQLVTENKLIQETKQIQQTRTRNINKTTTTNIYTPQIKIPTPSFFPFKLKIPRVKSSSNDLFATKKGGKRRKQGQEIRVLPDIFSVFVTEEKTSNIFKNKSREATPPKLTKSILKQASNAFSGFGFGRIATEEIRTGRIKYPKY